MGTNNLTVSGGFNTLIGGAISGSGALSKTGGGTLTLTNGNNYSGGTTVSAGTLAVNNTVGSATGTNLVAVLLGGTLGGSGFISGPVTVSGTLSPGNSAGTLTINNNLTLGATALSLFELGGTGSGQYDRVTGIGTLTLDGLVNVTLINSFTPGLGDTFDLFDFSLIDASNFDVNTDLALPSLGGGLDWDVSNFLVNGQIAVIVPEPSGTALLGLGLLSFLFIANWRRA